MIVNLTQLIHFKQLINVLFKIKILKQQFNSDYLKLVLLVGNFHFHCKFLRFASFKYYYFAM